jgi:hypothetical protein
LSFSERLGTVKNNWQKFAARIEGTRGQSDIAILMNKDVGQNIATQYPVYSMLNALNPDDTKLLGKYKAPAITQ